MAKRFGRNQRRKLREALAQAQEETKVADYNTMVQRELGRSARNTLAYVNDALRRFSLTACLPAESHSIAGDPGAIDSYRTAPDHSAAHRLEYWRPDGHETPERSFCHVDMSVLKGAIERDAQAGRTYVHLFLTGRGSFDGRWSYAASDVVWAQGITPDARQQVAERLIRELLEAVDRDLRAKGRETAR